ALAAEVLVEDGCERGLEVEVDRNLRLDGRAEGGEHRREDADRVERSREQAVAAHERADGAVDRGHHGLVDGRRDAGDRGAVELERRPGDLVVTGRRRAARRLRRGRERPEREVEVGDDRLEAGAEGLGQLGAGVGGDLRAAARRARAEPSGFASAYWFTAPSARTPFGPRSWSAPVRSISSALSTSALRGWVSSGVPDGVSASAPSRAATVSRSRPATVPERNRPSASDRSPGAAFAPAPESTSAPTRPVAAAIATLRVRPLRPGGVCTWRGRVMAPAFLPWSSAFRHGRAERTVGRGMRAHHRSGERSRVKLPRAPS